MATQINGRYIQGRRTHTMYVLPDGRALRAEELLKEFHADGEVVVDRCRNYKKHGLNFNPGWYQELKGVMARTGAIRGTAFISGKGNKTTRIYTDEGIMLWERINP